MLSTFYTHNLLPLSTAWLEQSPYLPEAFDSSQDTSLDLVSTDRFKISSVCHDDIKFRSDFFKVLPSINPELSKIFAPFVVVDQAKTKIYLMHLDEHCDDSTSFVSYLIMAPDGSILSCSDINNPENLTCLIRDFLIDELDEETLKIGLEYLISHISSKINQQVLILADLIPEEFDLRINHIFHNGCDTAFVFILPKFSKEEISRRIQSKLPQLKNKPSLRVKWLASWEISKLFAENRLFSLHNSFFSPLQIPSPLSKLDYDKISQMNYVITKNSPSTCSSVFKR